MCKIVICDDNAYFCDLVELLFKKYEKKYEIDIIKFYDGRRLLEYCRENKFDVLVLDIDLGEDNGMDIARNLKRMNPKSLVIYMSSYDYYKDLANAEPFRFIEKDASDVAKLEKEMTDALVAAINRLNRKDDYTFIFNKVSYTIKLHKVKFFCSRGRTIHICGDIGSVPSDFYYKIDKLTEELKEIDNNFVRISKSYIVNINYIKVNRKKQVIIEDKILSVTSKYKVNFLNNYYSKIREL